MSIFTRLSDDWPYYVSAGGVVIKQTGGQYCVALLYRKTMQSKYDSHYHLPKGTLKDNESLEHCALREIQEETGYKTEILAYLGGVEQAFHRSDGIFYDKVIHFFLCNMTGGSDNQMDNEHDKVVWFTIDEAAQKLKAGVKQEDEIVKRATRWLRTNG